MPHCLLMMSYGPLPITNPAKFVRTFKGNNCPQTESSFLFLYHLSTDFYKIWDQLWSTDTTTSLYMWLFNVVMLLMRNTYIKLLISLCRYNSCPLYCSCHGECSIQHLLVQNFLQLQLYTVVEKTQPKEAPFKKHMENTQRKRKSHVSPRSIPLKDSKVL